MSDELPPPNPAERLPSEDFSAGFSPKKFTTAWLFGFFLGMFGADRFYLEKRWSAVTKLVTVGGLFLWWVVDLWMLMLAPKDRDGLPLEKPANQLWFWLGTAVVTGFVFLLLNFMAGTPG